jgi:hypothetical protein
MTLVSGHAVAQLAKELRYNPEGRGFDYPMLSVCSSTAIQTELIVAFPWQHFLYIF